MYWFRASLLLFLSSPGWAIEGYIVGVGVEADSEDAIAGSVSGEIELVKHTWLSAAVAKNTVDLPRGTTLDTFYGSVGIEHWFDPVGFRAEMAYWGDNDIFDSADVRASVYRRGKKVMLGANFEYRDFEFDIFRNDVLPGKDVRFHAKGIGLTARFKLSQNVDLSMSGIDYRYSVDLRLDAAQRIINLLSISRLSLINSLVDYRARIGLGINSGDRRWGLDLATWKGEVDSSKTISATLRYIMPLSKSGDIEFGLGVDDSDAYGSATFFSVFIFFYG